METRSTSLAASSQVAIPLPLWESFTISAGRLCSLVFPQGEVALNVVDSEEIRRLNREYREVDSPTDVLSFPSHDFQRPLELREVSRLGGHVGDVALCWDAVQVQAKVNRNSEVAEAVALLAHSLLHLAGFEHRTDDEQAAMDEITVDLCRAVGIEVECFGH